MTADMADLRTRFLDRCVGDLARIDRHVARGAWDADELRRLVHSLAGAGAVFGFPAISEAAGDCDDAFAQDRTPDPALIETLAQAIRDALARRQG
ncbi:hypothetical protein GCM10010203_39330 [Actinomadura yumaensis]|uniref:Hpt domain-containing protein n=2 Tax=Caulobacteraceae TaxID=76892 RepID=UPI000C8F61F9|nr:hypothetical protein [Brevundimonas sp.]MBB1179397.1 hypothetical protein [Pseudomonas sp. FW305-3-2-15-E-TSA4]QFU31156.1 Hpt domain protein [Brevundimonas sp. Bb-A]HAF80627.1 hypothetical protein [Brevundimonas sp.]